MVTLPVQNRDMVGGTPVNTNVAAPLDFSPIAQGFDRHEQMQDRMAAKRADQALRAADTAYTAQYVPAAETYDGSSPGFAKAQGDFYDTEAAKARATLDARALPYFEEANAARRTERLTQAMGVEGRVLGGIARSQQAAAQTARVANASVGFSMATMDKLKGDAQGDAMLAPDYEQAALADFDARAKAALEAAPETDKAMMQSQLTTQRASLMTDLHTQAYSLRQARAQTDAQQGLSAVTNRVFNDPGYLAQAAIDAQKVTMGLPLDQREKVQPKIPATLAASAAEGFRSRGDFEGLKHFLANPATEAAMAPESYAHYQGYINSTAYQASQVAAQDQAQRSLENELVTLTQTGQSSGFDPQSLVKAFGPVNGPLMAAKAQRAINDARGDYQLVQQAADLPTSDFLARIDILKPQAGDADFADKQARYERARAIGGQIAQARLNDPAGAASAAKDGAPLWQAVQAGAPGAAKQWADYTLAKQAQWGVPEAQRRILPGGAAKQMVTGIQKAPPDKRDDAMLATWSQLVSFGGNAGRALSELQRAGLSAPDAAMLHISDGSPVMLGQYARAGAIMAAAPKYDKATTTAINKAVDNAFEDFGATYGYSTDGQTFAINLKQAVSLMTQANVHDGMDYNAAAKAAVKAVTGAYVVSRDGDYRMPADLKGAEGDIREGSYGTIRDYILHPEKLFAQPLAGALPLTDEQKRQNYAGVVGERAHFITTDDDAGLMMVMPSPKGGFMPVLDAAGKPIVKTWDQLQARAKAPDPEKRRFLR